MPELEPLDPATALSLMRSSSWHPEAVAAMLRHISDWLRATEQDEAVSHLSAICATDPVSGRPSTVPELIGAERSTVRRVERARKQATKQALLGQWRADRD